MKRFMALMSATAIGLGSMTAAYAADVDGLAVSVFPDADQSNVTEVYPTIANDLKLILEQRFSDNRAEDGHDVTVRLTEVSVDGSTILTPDDEFNRVKGMVYVKAKGDAGGPSPFSITVDAKTGAIYKDSDGMVVIPDKALFYNAMLSGFADKTYDAVQKVE